MIDEALQNCDDILSEAGYGINNPDSWFSLDDAEDVKNAMKKAYSNSSDLDSTVSEELFYDLKNGLIPYDPEKQFPNAYKIYQEKFSNGNDLGLGKQTFNNGAWLGKIDSKVVQNIRISTQSELGAKEWWVSGLRTSGGQFEKVS